MKYSVEMSYGLGVTVENIEANSREEAVEKAKKMVDEEVSIIDGMNIDIGDLEFDQVTYVSEDLRI